MSRTLVTKIGLFIIAMIFTTMYGTINKWRCISGMPSRPYFTSMKRKKDEEKELCLVLCIILIMEKFLSNRRKGKKELRAKLLDVGGLSAEGQGNDAGDVHLGTKDVHVEMQLLADGLDVLEPLLVVGTSSPDPDLGLVLDEDGSDFSESADDALEGGGYVGEVCNAAADEEDLALWPQRSTEHEVEDGAGVVVSLGLGGSTRVLSVVGELGDVSRRGDGVCVDDGCTTAGDEGPDAAVGVEDGELEGGTRLGVHVGDIFLLLAHLAAKGSREVHGRAGVDGDL